MRSSVKERRLKRTLVTSDYSIFIRGIERIIVSYVCDAFYFSSNKKTVS